MKLEVGKKYKNLAGNCVTIVSDNSSGGARFIGILRDANGYDLAYYFWVDGRYFKSAASQHDLIAEWTEPKPPQCVPYTADDVPMLRGRWFRLKGAGVEAMVNQIKQSCDGFFINGFSSSFFLENCTWLDGTPCGKVVE